MKKLFIFTISLLITSQTFASDYVARKVGYGSCLIKLSDELKCEKKYDFYADQSTVFDDGDTFIGLKRVEDALSDAGITDYKIETKAKGELLYFNIITNEKKDFLPLIMTKSGVFVNTSKEECDKDEIEEKVRNTKAYTSCYNKAYNMAIEDLKSLGRPDNLSVGYECISTDGDNITFIDNETVKLDLSVYDECSWTEDKSKDSE